MKKTLEGKYVHKAGRMLALYTEKAEGTETACLMTEPGKEQIIALKAEKEGNTARITILRHASRQEGRGQEMLTFMLNRLKKEGAEKAEITNPEQITEEAARAGFRKKGHCMEITGIQGKHPRVERKNERTIARYARKGVAYELKETEEIRKITPMQAGCMHIVKIEDSRTGLPVAVVEWREDMRASAGRGAPGIAAGGPGGIKGTGWIDAVKTSIESARMAKTALLYALWQMKKQGLKTALLSLGPEEGKKEKAEGLYKSTGFRPWPGGLVWEMDLERTRIQGMRIK